MLKIMIIHASTREGRQGLGVSHWVMEAASKVKDFELEFVDLKKLNLPLMDELNHPRLAKYNNQHTIEWSKKVSDADAFIFVTAEYNYGIPAPLKNAIDYLFHEWKYKPVGFVGYGGVAGGTRAIQQLKQVCSALRMFPFDGVFLPFYSNQLDENGTFLANERNEQSLQDLFAELRHLGNGMKALR